MKIPVEPAEDPIPKFKSVSVQTCPSKRSVRTQVVPKTNCMCELSMSVNEHNHFMYLLFFSNQEVQVGFNPKFQDVGVQCDPFQFSERIPLTANTSVQCDIECSFFASTPRIDCYSTSELEFSDAPQRTDTSSGMYNPSRDTQSSLS